MMRALKCLFLVGAVLVLAPPCFPHFVKAALGFRLGYSPTENAPRGLAADRKSGMGVQLLSGMNNGGWPAGGMKTEGTQYENIARSANSQINQSVRHLRILGMNLYLGGRAAQLGRAAGIGQPLQQFQPPIAKKSILGHTPYSGIFGGLVRPLHGLNLGANIGAGVKPVATNAANGGKDVGALAGIRGSVGSPNFGVGFNLGYRQAINTKSPLGWALGLGQAGWSPLSALRFGSPVVPPFVRGQDQVIVGGGGLLRGHGHANNPVGHAPVVGGGVGHGPGHGPQAGGGPGHGPAHGPAVGGGPSHGPSHGPIFGGGHGHAPNIFVGFPPSLESPIGSGSGLEPQESSQTASASQTPSITNPVASASNQQVVKQAPPTANNNSNQLIAQQSVLQPQQLQTSQSQQPRSIHNPFALGSTMRNNILSLFRPRPSMLRPSPYQYNYNSPVNQQALGSGPVRSVLNAQGQSQYPQGAPDASPQAWSTLYPVGGQQAASPNPFFNPLPAHGQSLSKLQASLRPGSVSNVPLNPSAQHQIPFVQQPQHQNQGRPGYSNFLAQGLRGIFGFGRQPPQQYPQQYYPQQYQRPGGPSQGGPAGAAGFGPAGAHGQAGGAGPAGVPPQGHGQEYNPFQPLPNPFQNLQHFQNALAQQSPFFHSNIQEPGQATQASSDSQAKSPSFPVLPQFPFPVADSPFVSAAEPKFRYSHSTHSKPVNVGSYTLNMDMTNSGGADPNSSASSSPIYGPGGRRIKKTKKTRGDIIIMKKQDNVTPSNTQKMIRQLPLDIMETSASTNQITLQSSLGATQWSPMVVVDPPKLGRKSLENNPVQIIRKPSTAPIIIHQSGSSSTERNERTMILRKRRLNEGETSPTVVPTSAPPTTSAPTTTAEPSSSSSPSSTTSSSTPSPVPSSSTEVSA